MSQVRRGGSRRATRRTSNRSSAAARAPRRLRNWAEAQLRSARYRAANAVRLGAAGLAVILVIAIGSLALTGRLSAMGRAAEDMVHARFAQSGFALASIDITGAQGEDAARIAEATGLVAGQSIFAANPSAIRDRVEAMPDVRDAAVARLWPDRIAIVVERRTPYALWQIDGALNIIDRDGVVLAEADVYNPPDLPLVVDQGAQAAVTEIVEALENNLSVAAMVVGAVRVNERRWNLRLSTGADVKLPETEVAAALAILSGLHAERGVLRLPAESFDLREEGDLIVRALPENARAAGLPEREA